MKFHGKIGYVISEDKGFGVYQNTPSEIEVTGEVEHFKRRWTDESLNGDMLYTNTVISFVAPPTLTENLPNIRYVIWHNVPWQITNVEEYPPRLRITLGGVYNGLTAQTV